MKRQRILARGAGVIALAMLSGPAQGAPIRTVSPSTGVFLSDVLVGRTIFLEESRDGMDVSARVYPVAGFYSPTANALFGLVIPYVEKRLEISGMGETTTRGLGDLTLIGHYRFWNRVAEGYADMAAARISLDVPTGSTDRRVRLMIPEPARRALQPGSGSSATTYLFTIGREHYRYNVDFEQDIG